MEKSNTLNILDLANEEAQHMKMQEAQFKSIMQSGKFAASSYEADGTKDTPPAILSQDLKDKVNAAGFEATAITAAIGFEQKTVKLYGERAETTIPGQWKRS